MKVHDVEVGPVTLCIAEAGAGGDPLLLLHGFTGAKEDFTDWLDGFAADGWHAVAPDHRGHGASAAPAGEDAYSLEVLAEDVVGLADALDWTRFSLLGHSMGGMVAQHVAIAAPERLAALVLMDTGHGPVEGIDPELATLAIEIARTQGLDALADLMASHQSPLSTPADQRLRAERPGYVEFGEWKFRACASAMYAAMVPRMLGQPDRLDHLRSLDVPTLVVVGGQDRAFLGPSRRLAEAIDGCRLVELPDAGHSPQFEAPEAWWTAVSGFLVEARATRAGEGLAG